MEGFNVPEPGDPGLDGPDTLRELYRALRGTQGDDPLADDMLWDGDFLTSQREFIQKQQEEQMLERLERRMGRYSSVLSCQMQKRMHRPASPCFYQSARCMLC
eukprot:GHUV01040109.1.p3 GENE.GHUV01040109.1~~GHUV01040109.1.p3  ORF type:complete len:103 (+),score=22.91 GHUV01040109.1:1405-1713(+)